VSVVYGSAALSQRLASPRGFAAALVVFLQVFGWLVLGTGCTPGNAASAKTYVIPAESREIFAQRCSVCHGLGGKGDGPASAALNPKPRNYSDPEFQARVDDAHISKIIVEGGPSVGLSPLMVANPDLKDKPDVVEGLVGIVRGFRTH
jgi:mono/diheme cytochrome c family protein